MLLQIENYDPTAGASLVTFTDKHVAAAVHDYVRLNCGVIFASEYDYDNLRNVMAAYYENPEANEIERFESAIEKTGLNADAVRYHLHHGDLFRYSDSLTSGRRDGDDDYLQLIERTGDIYDSPEYIVLEKLFYEAIVAAVDKLPFKEKHIILGYYGLERYKNRFKEVAPLSKPDLAAHLHIGKVQSVDDNARRAVKILRTVLEKQGWIEDKHTPELIKPAEKDKLKLTDLDSEIIDYAVRKWQKSGKAVEFHMLFRDRKYVDERLILEFLKGCIEGVIILDIKSSVFRQAILSCWGVAQ